MNFEEFKMRYAAKLVSTGFFESVEDALSDEGFNDRMAELYLGLMVYAEFQNEQLQIQKAEHEKRLAEEIKKINAQPAIILPGGPH